MKLLSRSFAVAVAIALLSACGTAKVAVRPEAAARIHTVAVITIAEPEAYVAQDFGNPGLMFGGVGGIVAGSSSASAGKTVDQIAADAGFAAGERLTRYLQDQLVAAGYDVKLISVERAKGQKLLEGYEDVDAAGADAILDVAIESIGYATEHPMFSPHWRPASQVKVALVDSRSHEIIYTEKFMYGYHNPLMSGTDLDAPETYRFKDKSVLFADTAKLVDGMRLSVTAVGDHVVAALKK